MCDENRLNIDDNDEFEICMLASTICTTVLSLFLDLFRPRIQHLLSRDSNCPDWTRHCAMGVAGSSESENATCPGIELVQIELSNHRLKNRPQPVPNVAIMAQVTPVQVKDYYKMRAGWWWPREKCSLQVVLYFPVRSWSETVTPAAATIAWP